MQPRSARERARQAKALAKGIGFDAVGICGLQPIERNMLEGWLESGFAGRMSYMHRQAVRRKKPQRIAPGCRRAIVVLKSYYQETQGQGEERGRVARYAWGEDYHRVVGEQLAQLSRSLVELGSSRQHTCWYVDAGPVPERELAQRTGLGWIGKNTMLISPQLGSFTFIGTVFTDLELEIDDPFEADRCGSCRRCVDACPTHAFAQVRMLDARLCISYLTIEYRGDFEAGQGELLGEWLFGCDVCQDVCPWNEKFAASTGESRFAPREAIVRESLEVLSQMAPATFERLYSNTALERAGLEGLRRNSRQVLRNLGAVSRGKKESD